MRTPAENAQVALLLEVAGTPKPGNVDRNHDLAELRFEHFLAGAVGAGAGLRAAEGGAPVGEAFERAVEGMRHQEGGNTQFGCLLNLVPLVAARAREDLSPTGAGDVVEATTVEDACDFYRAFDHVAVAVDDPPAEMAALDVRRGSEAIPAVRERGLTLADVLAAAADRDANAREWTDGFPRTFREAAAILDDEGPVLDRSARAFLRLLGEAPDTLVAVQHGDSVAHEVQRRAAAVDSLAEAATLADEFVERGINPGTTADLTAAALYVALERGLVV